MWIIGILAFVGLCYILGAICPHDEKDDAPSILRGLGVLMFLFPFMLIILGLYTMCS